MAIEMRTASMVKDRRSTVVVVAKDKRPTGSAADKKRPKPAGSERIQTTASFWNVPG
jgi:hypothetical protein